MTRRDDLSAHCVVRDHPRKTGSGDADNCRIVDSVQRLLALGLGAMEIEGVGLPEATLQALCEYARLDENTGSEQPTDLVETALETLTEEMRKADMELEMLGLRKRALTKRSRLLHKLAAMLEERAS